MQESTVATRLRPDLTAHLNEFDLSLGGFIGSRVMPYFDVDDKRGEYPKLDAANLAPDPDVRRSPRGKSNELITKVGRDTYDCENYGLREFVTEEDAKVYGSFFNAEQQAAEILTRALMGAFEARVAALIYNTTTFPLSGDTGINLTDEWDDNANGTPVTDAANAKAAIYRRFGMEPNAIIIPYQLSLAMAANAQILGRLGIATNVPGELSEAQLAYALGIKHVLIPKNARNTANEGQTATFSDFWSREYVWIGRIAETTNLREPCIGRTMAWRETAGRFRAKDYEEAGLEGRWIEVQQATDEKVLMPIGYLIGNASTL